MNIPRLTAHYTRHTVVTLALKAGSIVQEARALARHASINSTMIYTHHLDRSTAGTSDKAANAIFEGGE
jgi:integrase/recombinase XerD